jgi:hypothetical protein
MPNLLREKNESIEKWINDANYQLKYNSGTIEDFVK